MSMVQYKSEIVAQQWGLMRRCADHNSKDIQVMETHCEIIIFENYRIVVFLEGNIFKNVTNQLPFMNILPSKCLIKTFYHECYS